MSIISMLRGRQKGLSLISFLFFAALSIALIVTGMRCIPSWIENASINRAIQKLVSSGETNVASLRQTFDSNASVNDIKSIRSSDLSITVADNKVSISYEYESRVEISKNIAIVFTFNNE